MSKRTRQRHDPVRKAECYVVLMRHMRPDAPGTSGRHGRWEPVSTNGFVVVCHSKLEAAELTWFMGVRFFARPQVAGEEPMDDMRYLEWLWAHHLKVQRWDPKGDGVTPGDKGEINYGHFVHGWTPDMDDLLQLTHSPSTQMVATALHTAWRDL